MGLGNTDDMMVIQFNYKLPVRNIKVPLMALAIVLLTHHYFERVPGIS